jgi:hypothetical protein
MKTYDATPLTSIQNIAAATYTAEAAAEQADITYNHAAHHRSLAEYATRTHGRLGTHDAARNAGSAIAAAHQTTAAARTARGAYADLKRRLARLPQEAQAEMEDHRARASAALTRADNAAAAARRQAEQADAARAAAFEAEVAHRAKTQAAADANAAG